MRRYLSQLFHIHTYCSSGPVMHVKLWPVENAWFMLKIPLVSLLHVKFFLLFLQSFSPIVVSLPNICESHAYVVMLLIDLPI